VINLSAYLGIIAGIDLFRHGWKSLNSGCLNQVPRLYDREFQRTPVRLSVVADTASILGLRGPQSFVKTEEEQQTSNEKEIEVTGEVNHQRLEMIENGLLIGL